MRPPLFRGSMGRISIICTEVTFDCTQSTYDPGRTFNRPEEDVLRLARILYQYRGTAEQPLESIQLFGGLDAGSRIHCLLQQFCTLLAVPGGKLQMGQPGRLRLRIQSHDPLLKQFPGRYNALVRLHRFGADRLHFHHRYSSIVRRFTSGFQRFGSRSTVL